MLACLTLCRKMIQLGRTQTHPLCKHRVKILMGNVTGELKQVRTPLFFFFFFFFINNWPTLDRVIELFCFSPFFFVYFIRLYTSQFIRLFNNFCPLKCNKTAFILSLSLEA
jgi:hypothetical protein